MRKAGKRKDLLDAGLKEGRGSIFLAVDFRLGARQGRGGGGYPPYEGGPGVYEERGPVRICSFPQCTQNK